MRREEEARKMPTVTLGKSWKLDFLDLPKKLLRTEKVRSGGRKLDTFRIYATPECPAPALTRSARELERGSKRRCLLARVDEGKVPFPTGMRCSTPGRFFSLEGLQVSCSGFLDKFEN